MTDFEAKKKSQFEVDDERNRNMKKSNDEIQRSAARLWNLNMKCYMNGEQNCIQDYDQTILAHQKIKRMRIKDVSECLDDCLIKNPMNFEQKEDIKDEKGLTEHKNYQVCTAQCVETAKGYFKRELDILNTAIDKLKNNYSLSD